MKFPVFRTTLEAFKFCWGQRNVALRLGALPLVLHAILTFAGNAIAGLHIVSDDSPSTTQALVLQLALAALQMLVFLPLTVTWFRIVVIGEHEALQRSMFTFGRTERRFFGL